ncbi:TPA: hypothetical protein LGF94_001433 [Campylobacter jejuni]|nr:hypothetical protein [Campylobacter jejuni]EIY0143199.1 hypothetical protein [Campylobacter jejuni]EIY7117942.1 hypothetical protein [Campylobacter jejuni]HBK2102589.1 hypothetical protein [Campylobacter jejuni]HEC3347329.1 hypothetical protein [Campylobacter jejuni]
MKKVVFKCCLSGNIFYKKGDEVLLEDSEALRLLEKGIVEIVEQEEQKQNTDEKSNTDKKPQEDQEMQEKPQKQNEKEDKKGDEVLLEDSEALRLLEKGIVEIVEQEEQKQNTDEKSNTDKKPQEDQEMQEKPQKQNEKEDKKGKK